MNLINELRELAEDLYVGGYNRYASAMSKAADELEQLRAKIASMEQQAPVEWQSRTRPVWNDGMWTQWSKCSEGYAKDIMKSSLVNDWIYEARPLYALPGAKPQLNEIKIALQRALGLGQREAWTGARKHRSWEDQREEQQCWNKVWNLLSAPGEEK